METDLFQTFSNTLMIYQNISCLQNIANVLFKASHMVKQDNSVLFIDIWQFNGKKHTLLRTCTLVLIYRDNNVESEYFFHLTVMLFKILSFAEAMTYSCFCELMKRMSSNFPHGGAMDTHFANMRSLIQVDIYACIHYYSVHCCYKLYCSWDQCSLWDIQQPIVFVLYICLSIVNVNLGPNFFL